MKYAGIVNKVPQVLSTRDMHQQKASAEIWPAVKLLFCARQPLRALVPAVRISWP